MRKTTSLSSQGIKKIIRALSILILVLVLCCSAQSKSDISVCQVGCNYNAIGLAINAASEGDTIWIHNGVYKEHLKISKAVTLRGESNENTIIEGSNLSTGIYINSNNVKLDNFAIWNCENAIYLDNSNNSHITNILISNSAYGIRGQHAFEASISNNTIKVNSSFFMGAEGIRFEYCEKSEISKNRILINFPAPSSGDSLGIVLLGSSGNEISENVIQVNNSFPVDSRNYGAQEILLMYSNENTLVKNRIDASTVASPKACHIKMFETKNNSIKKNIITQNVGNGLCIDSSLNTRITGNSIEANTGNGIVLLPNSVLNTFFSDNRIYLNEINGVLISSESKNNTIVLNDFKDNRAYDLNLGGSSYNNISNNKICKIYYTETNILASNDCPYTLIISTTNFVTSTNLEIGEINTDLEDGRNHVSDSSNTIFLKLVAIIVIIIIVGLPGLAIYKFVYNSARERYDKKRTGTAQLNHSKQETEEIAKLKSFDTDFIYNYVKRYGQDSSNPHNLAQLSDLLLHKGINLNISTLLQLIKDELIRQKHEEVQTRILKANPTNADDCMRIFLDIYGERYTDFQLEDLNIVLEDRFQLHRSLNDLEYDLEKSKKEIKLERFEKELKDPRKRVTISEVDSMSGYDFERFLQKLFAERGYSVVHTKLSGDQGADLIITKYGERTAVQAKRSESPIGNKAIQEVLGAMKMYNCNKGMIVTNNQYTTQAMQLANKSGIELIDGDKLEDWITEYHTN